MKDSPEQTHLLTQPFQVNFIKHLVDFLKDLNKLRGLGFFSNADQFQSMQLARSMPQDILTNEELGILGQNKFSATLLENQGTCSVAVNIFDVSEEDNLSQIQMLSTDESLPFSYSEMVQCNPAGLRRILNELQTYNPEHKICKNSVIYWQYIFVLKELNFTLFTQFGLEWLAWLKNFPYLTVGKSALEIINAHFRICNEQGKWSDWFNAALLINESKVPFGMYELKGSMNKIQKLYEAYYPLDKSRISERLVQKIQGRLMYSIDQMNQADVYDSLSALNTQVNPESMLIDRDIDALLDSSLIAFESSLLKDIALVSEHPDQQSQEKKVLLSLFALFMAQGNLYFSGIPKQKIAKDHLNAFINFLSDDRYVLLDYRLGDGAGDWLKVFKQFYMALGSAEKMPGRFFYYKGVLFMLSEKYEDCTLMPLYEGATVHPAWKFWTKFCGLAGSFSSDDFQDIIIPVLLGSLQVQEKFMAALIGYLRAEINSADEINCLFILQGDIYYERQKLVPPQTFEKVVPVIPLKKFALHSIYDDKGNENPVATKNMDENLTQMGLERGGTSPYNNHCLVYAIVLSVLDSLSEKEGIVTDIQDQDIIQWSEHVKKICEVKSDAWLSMDEGNMEDLLDEKNQPRKASLERTKTIITTLQSLLFQATGVCVNITLQAYSTDSEGQIKPFGTQQTFSSYSDEPVEVFVKILHISGHFEFLRRKGNKVDPSPTEMPGNETTTSLLSFFGKPGKRTTGDDFPNGGNKRKGCLFKVILLDGTVLLFSFTDGDDPMEMVKEHHQKHSKEPLENIKIEELTESFEKLTIDSSDDSSKSKIEKSQNEPSETILTFRITEKPKEEDQSSLHVPKI